MNTIEHHHEPIAETDDNPGLIREDAPDDLEQNSSQRAFRSLFHVAWLSIVLGVLLEIVLVVIAGVAPSFGDSKPVIVDLAQKVTWSFFVCMGLAVATIVTKARMISMGAAGFLAAPLSFYIARAVHKALSQALNITNSSGLVGASPILLATCKGVEYGFLGAALGWLATRPRSGMLHYVGIGIFTGLTFGSAIVGIMASAMAQPPVGIALYTRLANELLFPIGCALVIFTADMLAKK